MDFFLGSTRDAGVDPQSLVSVPNIPGLNSKSLRSAFLIAIRTSDGDVRPDGSLDDFRRVR